MKVSDKYNLDLFRQVVGARAHWKCEYPFCHASGHDLNAHHWIGKDNKAVRYMPDNGIYLCTFHHTAGYPSAHGNPDLFRMNLFMSGVRTINWLNILTVAAGEIVKFNNSFREDWKEKLMAELKRLGVRGWRP